MNLLQKTERLLKQNWKERKRITLAVIVSFLINGGVGYATEEDVTLNQSSSVDIKPKNTSSIAVTKDTTTGGTVVDIAKPNDGISHNIYDTFNMNGKDSRVLFNNSGKDESMGESALGFKNVHKNKNFDSETKSATLIISEITGETSTKLEGNLEVRNDNMNQNTDLIFANENGISVNGIKYFGVGSVMYVNDRDWATKEELEKRRRELELEKEKSNNKDIVKPFGHSKKSAGAIHSGKKEKKDFHSNEKVEWEVPDGISKNEEKEKGLEAEKRRLEEEKKRLEAEKQKQEEQERLEKERKEKEKEKQEEAEKRRLEEEKKRLEAEKQKQEEQERLEKERKEKEKEKQEEAEKRRLEEEKIENIEKKLEEVKRKMEVEEASNGENNLKNDVLTPLSSPEAPTTVSYISTSALGSMHGNQILMKADDSGFYGVQYSSEQKKSAILIDKKTGEIDVKTLTSSLLTPKTVKLTLPSQNKFEEIPKEDIEGKTKVTPITHNVPKKEEEDKYNLEEDEVTEEDVTESDINKVNKNITMDGYQSNGLIPRTFKSTSNSSEYKEIPKDVIEEQDSGTPVNLSSISLNSNVTQTSEIVSTSIKDELKTQKALSQSFYREENIKPVATSTQTDLMSKAVTVPTTAQSEGDRLTVKGAESGVGSKILTQSVPTLVAAPKTIPSETLKEAVEAEKPKTEVLKRLNHIEVKDPSKTQLEKVDGHDKSTLIQIAAANDNGISHNEYDQFSIDQDENVLLNNNSSDSESASKLLNGKTFAGNKNLKGKSASLIINEVGLNNQGATKLAGGLEVLGKKSDIIIANENGVIVNGGRFENVGDLTLSTGKYKEGRTKEDFQFEERKGKIDVVGKSDIQNNLNIYSKDFDVNADLSAQNLNVDAAGQVSVKNATVSIEDVVDINTKTLRNSNAKIQSKNAVKIKGEDIFNEENSKISADVLLIDGKKVENSGEIEASYKLGIHATEDIINKRVIAGKILDLKAGKSFKNIDSALLYAQEQLQVDANEISNIGSSILSNGSLFLRGENAITNEKGGMIQSKGDGRLIGRKITNNASSISSLAKLYLKTDELLNIGEFNSSLKVTDQVRKLYKHVDVRESSWKAWYNGYNITVSIPRAKKELRVKQALINAGDDLVISKYKNDKTQVYNRDSSITSRGNIYVEGSIDNLTTTSASTLESILKRTKVKLAWNTSSLVDRSQFSSGVDVDGASLFDLLKEKNKLKRYQYFNLLKGLNDSELDRILNQALGEDWKAKDDIPDLKLGGTIEYYSADNRARVDSSKNIFVEGDIENSSIVENVSLEQWKKEKPKIDQEARRIEDALFNTKVTMLRDNTIAQENIDVDGSRKVSVLALLREKDPKKRVAYFEKLKTINDPKLEEILASTLGKDWKSKKEVPVIKEGYVGKKKKENTIYQMILEDGDERGIDDIYQLNNNDVKLRNILQKQNGKYEKLKDNREFLFKTSDIIKDKVQYKGYDYLVEGLKAKGKNTSKTKLIGDSQYQYDMISNLWKSYDQKAPDKEYIEDRFKASLEEANRLNLEIGKPLTKQQQKELNRSIIWYVEKEIEGEKVLTPVMYFPEDKLHTLSRIREDKAISKISAWGNIFGESDNVTNENSTINAVKNVKLRTNVLVNRGSKEFDSDIYAGEDLDIEAKKVLSEFANLKATGNIDVTARNIDVTASDIVSKSNVNLRAENIDIKDKILKSSTKDINSKTVGKAGHIMEDVTTSTETSRASNIRGENVSVRADENLNVKGSKIRAEETAEFDAAKVNIEASKTEKKDSSRAQGSGVNSKGLLEYLTEETATRKTEETNESSIEAGKNLYVKAKEDLHLKGSDLKARNATLSGRKVTIENEEEKSSEESSKFSSQVFGISNEKKSTKSTKARGSNVEATGTLVVEAEEEAKIKGSNLKAGQGYVDAKKTKFEAAKETYEEKVSKTSLGLTASGSAGILGVGVEGEADGAERSAGGSVVNEYKNKKLPQGTNGGRKSSALAEGEIGLKLAHQKSEKEEQKWKNSTFKTTDGDLNVTAKGENDIGGLDISSKGETNIVGKKVLTTKQKNTTKEQSYGFELSAKQSGGTTSSVVDALTTAKEIADDSQNGQLNKGLAAAKTIGAATGLLFNDLAGVQSRQSLNFSFNHSKSEMEEDTKNKIHSEGKLNIRSTEEDIELKNTEIKSKEKVTLDSERDIKVSGGKKIEKSEGHQFRAEAHLQESAGFGALSGGNTQVGIGGSTNYEREESSSTTNENSTIGAKDLQIRSKRHTDIKGANVRAEEKATVKVGGNLTVKSETDQYKEQKVKANAGLNGSLGVSSNTIVTGNGNASAGGGQIWKEGERITERSGLTAGNSMDIEVGGNLNVDSATVGSDIKKGKLDVEGDINTTDRTTQEKSGGAVVGASGGLTGEIGADLEIGDKKNREVKSNSVLSFQKENISAKKVTQNGEKSNIESLKTDMVEETEVVRNEFEKGGSANLSFSVNDTKKIAGAVKGAVKSAVQKVRSYTSSSENLSSSGRGHRTEEISTPTRRQEDSREDIYSKLSGEGVYSLAGKSGSQEGTYENVGAGKRGEAPEKPARKVKGIEAENPYSTIGDSESIPKDRKALANRPLPEIPGVRKSSESSDGIYETIKAKPTEDKLIPKSQRASSGDYESIPEEKIRREKIQSRELSELPKVVQKSSNNKKIERIYEDLDSIQRTSDGNAKEPVYAKVDLSKKTPKVVSQEEVIKQKAEELTKQYGPKVTVTDETGIYSQVKRVGKPSTPEPETLTVKPKFAEEGLTSRSQRTAVDYEKLPDFDEQKANSIKRENPYELDGEDTPIPEIRKAGEREVEAIIKTRTVNGEDTYEPIIRRKYSDSKFDEISLSDPPSLRERLQQEAGQKLTFTETSVSNTDYIPKKLSKNEIEALSEKARKVAENKDPHEATMEKIKKIAEDPNNIPKEHLLSKLEEYTYGYKNDDVIRLANRSAEEGSKLIVPDMVDKSKITKQDQKNLGEIMEKLPFSDDYNQFRRQVDEKIYDKLSNNPEFKDLMNKPLSGNEANIQKLFDIVVQAKKDSFKELAGVDIETPKLVLNKDKKQKVHGEYLDDTVTMGAVPPIKSKKQEDHNKELLNTIIHELTHHDQAYLAGNKDNPNLKRNLQEEARVFGVNQDLYVPIASHKHGYKEQPLERDAFRAGDALSDRLMKKVYRGSEESGLKGIGNTDYIPKPVTKKQREALEKKAKKYQQSDEFADSYNNFRNGIDQKIMDNLSIDPQFKKLINSDLSGDFEKVKELISVVARAKKNSLEAMGETNIPKTELQLKEAVAVSSNGRNRDEQNADILNNILKQYTYRIGEEAGTALVKKISGQKVEETAEGIGNTTYIPKKVDTAEIEKLSKQAKEKHENRDSEKEALKKLQTIAQAAGELPKEHLVKALAEMTKGRSFEEIAALYQKAKETGIRNIVRPDTIGEFSGETAKAMGELYKKVSFDDSYIKAREEINKKTLEKLDSNKEFHDLMKTKLSGNTEAVRKLYDMVVTAKNESLQEVTGIKAPKPELKISEGKRGYLNPVEGVYHNDVVKMNDTPFLGFTKTKKQNNRQLLDTLIHELTHYDQDVLTRSTKNPNLPEALRPDIDLMNHNFKYYINSRNDYFTYKKQPVEREAFLSGHKLAEDLGKALARGFQGEKADGVGNTKYIPEKLSGAKKKALFDDAKKQAKQRDTAKEAEKKLKLLAENADSIPKEHMIKAVKELAYGLSVEDATALRKKAVELGTKIHRPDMIEGFEGKNVKNMGEILKKIQFDQEYVKTREEINQKIVEKLDSNKEFHDLMKQKLSGNEEGIKKLFKMVESAKHDSLKEVTGIDGKRAEVVLNTERGPLSMKQGHYADNEVNMNAVPLLSFLRTKKQNNKEILDTIVHELTHHDQAQITRNKDRNLPEHMKQDADLMALNETYYINSDLNNFSAYKNQPLEREAFISGHKLGEQLSKLVDKGYTGDAGENGKLREIKEIEHLPNKVNNLESPREAKAELGDNALIYGLKYGRQELIDKVNAVDPNRKNATMADSYIGKLNLGYEFEELTNFAKKVNKGEVTEADIREIANFNDPGAEHARKTESRSRINAANNDDNQKIMNELLKNETAVNSLKKVGELSEKIEDVFSQMRKNEYLDLDNPKESPSFTEEQNRQIREFRALENEINNARMDFFTEKTKLIAKETLDRGGKLYFALDGLATDSPRYTKNTNVDFDKLKGLFDPGNPYYDAVTSRELRYLYDNYRDNPNLKFTVKDHVIENPLKTLKVEEVETPSERDRNSVVMEKSLLPKLFKSKSKDQGPVIKHLGGEETTSHYFSLDKIVTKNADISRNMKVNLDNIKKAFTPDDRHYNDSESKSLREMYKKDPTMEQTKFIIGNQVIENPFKNPELQEYIKSQQGREAQVVTKAKKAEAKKVVNPKAAGGQETSNAQEAIYAQVRKGNRGQAAVNLEAPNKPLPPVPVSRVKRGAANESSSNQRALRSQESGFVEDGYYVDRVVNQSSQAPSRGEPIYADLQFGKMNSGRVQDGHLESEYAEIGRKNTTVSEETIYENVNSLQRPALPPIGVKTPVKPAVPNRKPISSKK
ncbi:hypothetical protein A2U04_03080 [Fusobacterium necrophorum subsp. funduliforme]|uniref:hemagglutinin repeat-containing protein n=1 Tax=Fusobacterium necrophorum TaxID=859 RepID=UPI0007881A8E|nr:hemagglutinin repeat-containing protein [Fusobacterium necrophorum]KYM48771.1 hypothetical protein A2U04_03080 [Fusobacterium necrophorum subsp. funduliforme]